jgi:hypothetical protein
VPIAIEDGGAFLIDPRPVIGSDAFKVGTQRGGYARQAMCAGSSMVWLKTA